MTIKFLHRIESTTLQKLSVWLSFVCLFFRLRERERERGCGGWENYRNEITDQVKMCVSIFVLKHGVADLLAYNI